MEDGNLETAGGLPDDFLKRFEDPESWQHSLRVIDTLMIRESSLRNQDNGIDQAALSQLVVPVLNAYQVDVAIDSGAATWLHRRASDSGQSVDTLLEAHADWLESLIDSRLRLKTISLQSVLSKTAPGDAAWEDYPLHLRIADVVEYAKFIAERFPSIDVGIIDALPTHGRDWQSAYEQLTYAIWSHGLHLDHVHLDMPVDFIGEGKNFVWQDVLDVQYFVQQNLQSEFGLMLTSAGGGNFSENAWHRQTLVGVTEYAEAISQSNHPELFPDKIVFSSWFEHPQRSVPEAVIQPLITGAQPGVVRSMTRTINQSSNALRGMGLIGERLQDELLQVFPHTARTSAFDSGFDLDRFHAAFATGVTDGFHNSVRNQWRASEIDFQPFFIADFPTVEYVDRVKLWPHLNPAADAGSVVNIYVSESGIGSPVSHPDQWRFVAETDLRYRRTGIESQFSPVRAKSVALTFHGYIAPPGIGAIRVFSPNLGWYKPYRSPLERTIPHVDVKYFPVFDDQPGEFIASLLIDGTGADQNYTLSVDDSRMTFKGNTLRLKPDQTLARAQEPALAVWVKLVSKDDPGHSFHKLVRFLVYDDSLANSLLDFGDAPAPYPSTLAADGARHVATGPRLGIARSTEPNGQPSAGALLDSEDDGVQFSSLAIGDSNASVEVEVSLTQQSALLNAWIDFNGDGSWDSAGEQIFVDRQVFAGNNVLSFSIPGDARPGTTYARFRINRAGGLSVRGSALDGEVEDYRVFLQPPEPGTGIFVKDRIQRNVDGARVVKPADVDQDGDQDIVVVAEFDNEVFWLENQGDDGFEKHSLGFAAFAMYVFPADIDGDGDIDVLAAAFGNESLAQTVGNEVILFENDGTNQFSRHQIASGLRGAHYLSVADIDQDGDQDFTVASSRDHRFLWYENTGQRIFVEHELNPVGGDPVLENSRPRSIEAVDFDRDGDMDFVTASQDSHTLAWWENIGQQAYVHHVVRGGFDLAHHALPVDLDSDGDMDIIAGGSGAPSWYQNTGSGNFVFRFFPDQFDTRRLEAADLDGDGDMDVIAVRAGADDVVWYENLGGPDLTFENRSTVGGMRRVQHVESVDIDSDGDLDLVAASWQDDSIWLIRQGGWDYGDAPNSYQTTSGAGGPRHGVGSLRLGSGVDAEPDGQPDVQAGQDSFDDGVQFLSTIVAGIPGFRTSIHVTPSKSGMLDGWIDWNRNGAFEHPQEHISLGDSLYAHAGSNIFAVFVPDNAIAGPTYARFRLSSNGHLSPTGDSIDGEVEDYFLSIVPADPITPPNIQLSAPITDVSVGANLVVSSHVDHFRGPAEEFDSLKIVGGSHDESVSLEWTSSLSLFIDIDGREGENRLRLRDQLSDLTDTNRLKVSNFQTIDLLEPGTNQVVLDSTAIDQLSPDDGVIVVVGNSDDHVVVKDPDQWSMHGESEGPNFVPFARHVGTDQRIDFHLSRPWQNQLQVSDVNNDSAVTASDALRVINELRRRDFVLPDSTELMAPQRLPSWPNVYVDQNGDGLATALDALRVINDLVRQNALSELAEGEFTWADVVSVPIVESTSMTRDQQTLTIQESLLESRFKSHPKLLANLFQQALYTDDDHWVQQVIDQIIAERVSDDEQTLMSAIEELTIARLF